MFFYERGCLTHLNFGEDYGIDKKLFFAILKWTYAWIGTEIFGLNIKNHLGKKNEAGI
jgi:hypothetical protein